MKELNFECPINPLSLGNVSINFLKEIYKRGIKTNIFPHEKKIDVSSFNLLDGDFLDWVKKNSESPLKNYKREIPTLKVWHINGSEKMLGENQYLYTFYEVDSPTKEEINIVKAQKHVFFSSSESANLFKKAGCDNVSYVPLALDEDFYVTKRKYLDEDIVHFGLIGKFEQRKNTGALINLWVKKFGNNPKYQLTCLVGNPFIEESKMKNLIQQSCGKNIPNNVNFLGRLKTNQEVNDLINAIDIDLSGLSNGEGWNLPSFNATALGTWSIVTNCSSHKDWATRENSILIEPAGRQPCYDNMFFKEGLPFNQGNYSKIDEKGVMDGIERALKVAKQENKEGLKLREKFTYSKSIDKILTKIQ